jgi:hypothetical protein
LKQASVHLSFWRKYWSCSHAVLEEMVNFLCMLSYNLWPLFSTFVYRTNLEGTSCSASRYLRTKAL